MEKLKKEIIELFENENIEKSSIMTKELLEEAYKEEIISEKEYNELKIFIGKQIRKNKQSQRRKNAIINFLKRGTKNSDIERLIKADLDHNKIDINEYNILIDFLKEKSEEIKQDTQAFKEKYKVATKKEIEKQENEELNKDITTNKSEIRVNIIKNYQDLIIKYFSSKEINNSEIVVKNLLKDGFKSNKITKDEYIQLMLFFNEQKQVIKKQNETKKELKYIPINKGRFIDKDAEGR